jgi:hypothetical protein
MTPFSRGLKNIWSGAKNAKRSKKSQALRMTKGRAALPFPPVGWWREQQVPPLRCASVGMTIHIGAHDASAQENSVSSIKKSQALRMTKGRAALPSGFGDAEYQPQIPPLRSGRDDNSYLGAGFECPRKIVIRKYIHKRSDFKGEGDPARSIQWLAERIAVPNRLRSGQALRFAPVGMTNLLCHWPLTPLNGIMAISVQMNFAKIQPTMERERG